MVETVKEDASAAFAGAATNAMAGSSPTAPGPIAMPERKLGKKPLRNIIKRKPLSDLKK